MSKEEPAIDLVYEIEKEHSKRQVVRIAKWIGNDPKRFRELMALFLHGERLHAQRSAWALSYCVDRYPDLARPWLKAMLEKIQEPGIHDALPRNVLHSLQYLEIPRSLLGTAVSLCFRYMADPNAPVAIKCNAMTVLANAAGSEPALIHEIEECLDHIRGVTGGITARVRMVKEQIHNIKGEHQERSPRWDTL